MRIESFNLHVVASKHYIQPMKLKYNVLSFTRNFITHKYLVNLHLRGMNYMMHDERAPIHDALITSMHSPIQPT
jgi:hypothetical protein